MSRRSGVSGALTAPGGGGGGLAFPQRYDLSVNGAHIDDAGSSYPVLVTQTTVSAVGAYNGAGVGNKAIIGFGGHAPMPLGALPTIEWEWQQLDGGPPFSPYANVVVEMSPGVYRIFVIDPAVVGLSVGTLTALGPGHFSFRHIPRVDSVQIVNAFTTVPLVSPPVPAAHGGPPWQSASFSYLAISASFPGAQVVDASTLDDGMPKTTVTPALMICSGDSTNLRARSHRLLSVKLNGADA